MNCVCDRYWTVPESNGQIISQQRKEQELQIISEGRTTKKVSFFFFNSISFLISFLISYFRCKQKITDDDKGDVNNVIGEVSKTHKAIQSVLISDY